MRFVIFGLTVSSAWANGHATPWRGLLKALHAAGHHATFFERDVEYYASHRDLARPDYCNLVLYADWPEVEPVARAELGQSDVGLVTSYCPDGLAASRLVLESKCAVRAFYDLDTPITLAALRDHGLAVTDGARYLTPDLIPAFDLYLSFTGGPILDVLRDEWAARSVAPLYGSVDPALHAPVRDPPAEFRCVLGYLGTYAADRQPALERMLIASAWDRPADRFCVVGSMYPESVHWPPNVARRSHLDPPDHAAFYSANRVTLNVTRRAMLEWGYSPSGRIFEAAACGVPILSDRWPGVDAFFEVGSEILVADNSADVAAALDSEPCRLNAVGRAARERVLASHTSVARARELVDACEAVAC